MPARLGMSRDQVGVPRTDVEARDAPLVGDGAYLLLVEHQRRAGYVGDALELGRAFRVGNGRIPPDDARRHVHREQMATRGPDEEAAAA